MLVIQTPAGQQPGAGSQSLLEETSYEIGRPFGREIVVMIASASPLLESARLDDLPVLQRQLAQLDPDHAVAAGHALVDARANDRAPVGVLSRAARRSRPAARRRSWLGKAARPTDPLQMPPPELP